jgi:HEAT repeat protein
MRRLVIGLAAVAMLVGAGCSGSGSGPLSSSDPKEVVKQAAASAGDERAVERVAPLVRDQDAQTAAAAIVALSRMPSPKACETLRQVVATDQRPEVRRAAVAGLAQRTEPAAAEALRDTLTRDQAAEVREEAAQGLARVGTIDDVSVLANAAGRETNPKVAQSEVQVMGRLLGVKFPPPDPKQSPEQRKEHLQRARTTAVRLAEMRKNGIPAGGCKHNQ